MSNNQNRSTGQEWTTTFMGTQVPPISTSSLTSAIPSNESFVLLSTGEVLPIPTTREIQPTIVSTSTNAESSIQSSATNRRRVTFNETVTTVDLNDDDDDNEEEDDEGDDRINYLNIDDGEEDQDESLDNDDDEPSTSSSVRNRPSASALSTILNSETAESLLSTETQDLLNEIKQAYQKKRKSRTKKKHPTTRGGAIFDESDDGGESQIDDDDDDDEDEDDDEVVEEFLDDPLDEEYFPQKRMRRRELAKRRLQESAKARQLMAKKRKEEPTKTFQNKITGDTISGIVKRAAVKRKSKGTFPKRWINIEGRANDDLDSTLSDNDEFAALQHRKRGRQTSGGHQLPPEIQAMLGQANVSFAQGRMEEAAKLVDEVIRLHPNYYESYEILSMFHGVMGRKDKQLQFGLLSAHLHNNCDADKWLELAELAVELGEKDQAVFCYGKASRDRPACWEIYDAKIKVLEKMLSETGEADASSRKQVLKKMADTKLAAVKGLIDNDERFSTEEYIMFAYNMFQDFYENNDARRAAGCLKCILERGKKDGEQVSYEYLNNLVFVTMHAKDYEAALLAIFRYSKLQAFDGETEIELSDDKYAERIERQSGPRPLTDPEADRIVITHYVVPSGFAVDLMGHVITCWIRLKRIDCAQSLLEMLQKEVNISSAPEVFWEIAEALADGNYNAEAEKLLEQLILTPEYENSTTAWLCYADVLSSSGNFETAAAAFGRVVQLSPGHISARLSLSALQQLLGQVEEALHTLDMGDGRRLEPERMDERLLYQRCILLRQQESWGQFIMTGRFLMAMYFKDAYSQSAWNIASTIRYGGWKASQTLRAVILDAVRETNWEGLIKRVPRVEQDSVTADDVWEIFYQLCELMFERRMHADFFFMCCFASQCPLFLRGSHLRVLLNLLLFASIIRRSPKIAWALLRYCLPANNSNASWNVHGILFVFSQEVRYHRFTLRAMLRIPESVPLAWLSGNNSLISGTYQHALAEYYYILKLKPDDPMLNLLCGLCNLHLASKKFIARRHDLFVQGMAFLCKYEELRGPSQEVYYNIGRALQQTGVVYAAVHYYQRALAMEPMVTKSADGEEETDDGGEEAAMVDHKGVGGSTYDLRPLIAHNLALIYQNSNNALMAREILERYCTIE